jgi:pimeloyl-ACP methyl ester carboxylesterase
VENSNIVRRRFIDVDGRRAHYFRVGGGSPVLFVHSSPSNARTVIPHMRKLADKYTCFAFDTPGFGCSEALPLDPMEVSDLADALAANIRALGLPPVPVFGTHTGAAISLELGKRHPDLVTALVLDGVPIFLPHELEGLFDGYFAPLKPDPLGGHYAQAWTRFRDQSIWFPWTSRNPADLNRGGAGSYLMLNNGVANFFYCGKTYKPAYRAASFYGEKAIATAAALTVPAAFTALEGDMLYPHLPRLPPLRPNQEIRAIGVSHDLRDGLTAEYFARYPSPGVAPDDVVAFPSGEGIGRQFVDLPESQIHVRYAGDRANPTLVLLHDAPGSALMIEPLIAALSADHFVIAPDLPGGGESEPLPEGGRSLADYAAAVEQVCAQIGIDTATVYGIGFGASVAVEIARAFPALVEGVILRGLLLPEADERRDLLENYAPPIVTVPNGSHWYSTWLMVRDTLIFWPWYRSTGDGLRRVPGDFSADSLHDRTFEVMKQQAAYAHLIHAALDHDAAAALAGVGAKLLLVLDKGTPFSAYDEKLQALTPGAAHIAFADNAAHAKEIAAFTG